MPISNWIALPTTSKAWFEVFDQVFKLVGWAVLIGVIGGVAKGHQNIELMLLVIALYIIWGFAVYNRLYSVFGPITSKVDSPEVLKGSIKSRLVLVLLSLSLVIGLFFIIGHFGILLIINPKI